VATTGAVFPGTGAAWSVSPHDDQTWSNPGNILADDTSYAQITSPSFDLGVQSYLLRASNFNFSGIPSGATIVGITVRVNACYVNGSGSIDLVQLVNASGSLVGDNKASTPVALTTPSLATHTFGGSADTWNASPTVAMLQDTDFGVAVGCIATANDCDVYIDYITIEVEYTTGYSLSCEGGSYALNGQDAGAYYGRKVDAEAGAYALTGADISALFGRLVLAEAGAYQLTGQDIALLRAARIAAEAGAYALAGQDVTLIYVPGGGAYVLSAEGGAYAITGADAGLRKASILPAEPGVYVLAGQDATTLLGRLLDAGAGAYVISGGAAELLRAARMQAEAGVYGLTGNDAALALQALIESALLPILRPSKRIVSVPESKRVVNVKPSNRIVLTTREES